MNIEYLMQYAVPHDSLIEWIARIVDCIVISIIGGVSGGVAAGIIFTADRMSTVTPFVPVPTVYVPIRYVTNEVGMVPVRTLGAIGPNIVPVRVTAGVTNIVPVKETAAGPNVVPIALV